MNLKETEILQQGRIRLYGGRQGRRSYGAKSVVASCYFSVRYNERRARRQLANIADETACTDYRMSPKIVEKQKLARQLYATHARQFGYKRWPGLRHAPMPQWLRKYAGAGAKETLQFCRKHRILNELKSAVSLADECFPLKRALRILLDDDPEEEGQWIVIEVEIEQDVADFLDTYNRCISLWAKRIPTEALTLIRLSYSLA